MASAALLILKNGEMWIISCGHVCVRVCMRVRACTCVCVCMCGVFFFVPWPLLYLSADCSIALIWILCQLISITSSGVQYIIHHTLHNYIFYQLNNLVQTFGWRLENGVIIVAFELLVVLVLSLVYKTLWKGIACR